MFFVGVALLGVLAGTALASRSASTGKVFYLDVRPGECGHISNAAGTGTHKQVTLLPCSAATHNVEFYVRKHGGWSRQHRPSASRVAAIARRICLSSFKRRFGHPIQSPYGYQDFFADPGAETARYGDRVICGLRLWPKLGSMGSGTHF